MRTVAAATTSDPMEAQKGFEKSHQALENSPRRPVERGWRGNKSGSVRLNGVPDFKDDRYAERQWIKEHMAAAFRFWGKMGYAEGIAGHITVRDPVKPGHYWMNPFAVHYSAIKVSDLVLLDEGGRVTEEGAQLPINAAGFHIHSAIHQARPDVQAVAHCRSVHARAWSVFGKPIEMLTQDSTVFYDNLSVYANFGGTAEEGQRIANALGPKNKAVLLQNHGALTLGSTVDQAMSLFRALENACHVQLMVDAAAANGIPKQIIDDADAAYNNAILRDATAGYIGFQSEYTLLVEETNGAFLK